ncbi:MAG: ABC transporter ATP-binding protein [Geodermatophilaceae bacterium]|nr:ABC transporter ATP-binding protein [Geodermatophilaceae bacterium]MDQ3466428.1 ABC transporter ATP-binding protein [Actinomycetota bacterium]
MARRNTVGDDPAVVIDRLTVHRGGHLVLDAVSCEVAAGSVTGLLGPSGSGKSTLIRSVVGVQKISGGTVEVLGKPAGSRPLRSLIGYLTQAPSVYADLSVRENLRYFAAVLGTAPSDVDSVISAVGLTDKAGALVGRLSGGQRTRVSLAAALLGAPRVLVLDEPTVGLDPVLRRDLWELFNELAGRGTTLLVSSHVMDEAERCSQLLLLRDGRVLAADSPAAIRDRTDTHDLESAFLALIDAEQVPSP